MNDIKYFICPISKNVVDSIIELNSKYIGLLPTRRQIDYDGGYANNWTTSEFFDYVKSKDIIIERDHSGPNQGVNVDDGYSSFFIDSKYFDITHIDPWKKHTNLYDGLNEIIENIDFIYQNNNLMRFEIGTEEDIRKIDTNELFLMLDYLKHNLTKEKFDLIEYVVIQSGVSLDLVNRKNKGVFDKNNFNDMVSIVKGFGKKSKEHNGDYLSDDDHKYRFENGLDSVNIGPEFVQIETQVYLNHMNKNEIDEFYNICLESNKWKRWVKSDVSKLSKEQLIMVCGHYNYTKFKFPDVDDEVKTKIKQKINSLLKLW